VRGRGGEGAKGEGYRVSLQDHYGVNSTFSNVLRL
jgi:hypothetical protein